MKPIASYFLFRQCVIATCTPKARTGVRRAAGRPAPRRAAGPPAQGRAGPHRRPASRAQASGRSFAALQVDSASRPPQGQVAPCFRRQARRTGSRVLPLSGGARARRPEDAQGGCIDDRGLPAGGAALVTCGRKADRRLGVRHVHPVQQGHSRCAHSLRSPPVPHLEGTSGVSS